MRIAPPIALVSTIVALAAGGVLWWLASGRTTTSLPPVLADPASLREVDRIAVQPVFDEERRIEAGAAPNVVRSMVTRELPGPIAAFDRWLANYVESAPEQRALLLSEGKSLVAARRDAVAELIVSDPEAAILLTPSPAQRAVLPPEVAENLERIVATEGFYGVKAICNHGAEAVHGEGCRIEQVAYFEKAEHPASIYGSRKQRLTEENASLYGVMLDGRIALHEDDFVVQPAEAVSGDPAFAGQLAVIFKGKTSFVPNQAGLAAHIEKLRSP